MRKHGLGISSAQSMRAIKQVAETLGFKDSDDMLVKIGNGAFLLYQRSYARKNRPNQ